MSGGMRRIVLQVLVSIAAAIVLVLAMGQAARAGEPPGYWRCDGTKWVAVGTPQHPEPLVQCGGVVISDGGAITEELCEKAGGTWGPIGLFPEPICTQRTFDAGRYCADMGECAASCDAELTKEEYQRMLDGEVVLTGGICWGATPLIGCHAMVHAGKVDGVLCID
jgi:hypothetical protein